MSWMAKLYDTYETAASNKELGKDLEPYFHKNEPCHIEIVIDDKGNFKWAESLVREVVYGKKKYWKGENTIIPITPKSLTGRTSGAAPYPLAEQIQYVAKDYPKYGGKKKSYFNEYIELLDEWAGSAAFSHFKIVAIAVYVSKGNVVNDLLKNGILYAYEDDGLFRLIQKWSIQGPINPENGKKALKPPLFNAVSGNEQGNAKIRWRVQRAGDPDDATWGDQGLVEKWQGFQKEVNKVNGTCQVLGEDHFITNLHPKGIIRKVNDAKLISTPSDSSYLTFQGRFTAVDQPCGISFEVSQKSHNVLRWLIDRQGHHNDEQVYVSWAVSGKDIPEPLVSSWDWLDSEPILQKEVLPENGQSIDHAIDLGNSFAEKLNRAMKGYRTQLDPNEQIIIIGLDSATTGRMSIIYYRELLSSEFLDRIHDWHTDFAWPQRFTKEFPDPKGKKLIKETIWSLSSPAPWVIAEAAYGAILKSNKTLKKSVLERILPCIVDGQAFPRDIMIAAVQRASNPNSCDPWEWQRNLGIACALYKGFYLRHPDHSKRRTYDMALEEDNTSRDYLYGRLLAIAERIEAIALGVGGERRSTNASRLMQQFAGRPFSTWRNIELGLQPYMQRLQVARPGFLTNSNKELDVVQNAFLAYDFISDKPLSGEFLLGYHCQKQDWRTKKANDKNNNGENS